MTRSVLLLDGGLGQELIHRSSASAHHLWSLQVMLDEPHLVSEIHRDFCLAGAAIACLNTYAVTRSRLARGKDLPSLAALLETARTLAETGIRDSGCADVEIIASMPPLVASYRPDTQLPMPQMVQEYRELIDLQKDTVDGFLAETIPSITEARAVLQAASDAGVRILIGLTVSDEDGTLLRSGESLQEAIAAIAEHEPIAVLINCSRPESVSDAMPVLAASGLPFGGFANGFTAVDALEPGGVVDVLDSRTDLDPEGYARFAAVWLDAGASVIGGCCEVGPAHIAALDALLAERGCIKVNLSGFRQAA